MLNKNNIDMTAVIYFEGREVCTIEYDEVLTGFDNLVFNLESKKVADFTAGYSYVVISEIKIRKEKIREEKKQAAIRLARFAFDREQEYRKKIIEDVK